MSSDALTAPFVEVALPVLHRFHEEAAAEARDPLLGIHVGSQPSLQTWDVVQLAGRSARTLREALLRVPSLLGLFNRWVELSVEPGDPWRVTHRVPGEPAGLSRQGNELWVATLITQVWRATGRELRPVRVWFGHAAHPQAEEVAAALRVESVQFGAGSSGVAFTAADVEAPLLTADPMLSQVLDRLSAQALEREGGRRGTSALVYQAIRERIAGGVPGIAQVARALAVSTRSLQRALSDEGTQFRDLVEQVRRDLSASYAAEGLSVEETAERLGYSDPGSLSRARSRWSAG